MTAPAGGSGLSRTAWVSRVLGVAFTGAAAATQVCFQQLVHAVLTRPKVLGHRRIQLSCNLPPKGTQACVQCWNLGWVGLGWLIWLGLVCWAGLGLVFWAGLGWVRLTPITIFHQRVPIESYLKMT